MADSPRKPPCGTTLTLGAVGALAAVSAYQGRRGSGSRAQAQKKPLPWSLVLGMTGLAAVVTVVPDPIPLSGFLANSAALGVWVAKLGEYGVDVTPG